LRNLIKNHNLIEILNVIFSEKKIKLVFVVPVYNEEKNIGKFILQINDLSTEISKISSFKVIFVDDGSTDDTVTKILEYETLFEKIILENKVNRGPGFAFQNAFQHLATNEIEHDFIITIEGDSTNQIDLVKSMLIRIEVESLDIIISSPYLYGGSLLNANALKLFLSQVANTLSRFILNLSGIITISSFFRVYRSSFVKKLQSINGGGITQIDGFESVVDILIKSVQIGGKIGEVASKVNHLDRYGKSKLPIMKTSLGYLKLFFYNRISRKIS
jgi:glycosyltransferase involved in cell wall biosynthesis